jgi:hypothetical protein
MVTRRENERLTRVEAKSVMGQMMRQHYWLPFALSAQLVAGEAPRPVRLLGQNFVAFATKRVTSDSWTSCARIEGPP